jgi:hypothetical protein
MKENEISKILAEFEFDQEVEITGNHIYKKDYSEDDFKKDVPREIASRYYCDDLNTLIPIWKKLKNIGITLRFDEGEWAQPHSYFLIDSLNDEYGRKIPEESKDKKLQYQLAHATALAIQELKK